MVSATALTQQRFLFIQLDILIYFYHNTWEIIVLPLLGHATGFILPLLSK